MRLIRDYYVARDAIVTGDVALAAGVNIWFGCVLRGDLSRISLGPRVNLQDGCIVHTDFGAPLDVEEGVVVGHRATLHGQLIGRDTLVGMGAILLSGSEVGAECIIAAGSLVTEKRRIPPRSVVMGVPGKVGAGEVSDEDLLRTQAISAHYLDLAQRLTSAARSLRRGRVLPEDSRAQGPSREYLPPRTAVVHDAGCRTHALAAHRGVGFHFEIGSDRWGDVEGKQLKMAAFLQEIGCEGLLLLELENVAWMTSGLAARGFSTRTPTRPSTAPQNCAG